MESNIGRTCEVVAVARTATAHSGDDFSDGPADIATKAVH